jgi:N utilization substance protein B
VKALKIDWSESEEMIRRIYQDFRDSAEFVEYMNSKTDNLKADREILAKFVQSTIVFSDVLNNYFEEIQSMWSEDFYMALALVINTLTHVDNTWDEFTKLPPLFKTEFDARNDDKLFLLDLVRKTVVKTEKYDAIIKEKAQNWEFERIAVIDLILLKMGMVEIFDFPSIPLKVTLNEIIELAKHFSSERSNVFINGLLDRMIAEGLKDGTIQKTGRGLV